MAKRARVLLLTDNERNHRHARQLIDAGALPVRNPWLLGPADLDALTVSPAAVVALGAGAVLPAAHLRERLDLPGPRPMDLHEIASTTDLPLTGSIDRQEWLGAEVCHVDGVVLGGQVLFATASRCLGAHYEHTVGAGTGAVTIDDAEAGRLFAAAEAAVTRASVPDGAFHVELFDLPAGPVLLSVAPHPPSTLGQALTRVATGVDLLAEHIRAGVGRPTIPRRTRSDYAGYWQVPRSRTQRTRPTPVLPALHGEIVLATLPRPGRPAPTEVVVRAADPAVVLTDLISLRERLDESVSTT
ncbi:ATP-grasp domain-containing protein [Actinophytocola sediminis]